MTSLDCLALYNGLIFGWFPSLILNKSVLYILLCIPLVSPPPKKNLSHYWLVGCAQSGDLVNSIFNIQLVSNHTSFCSASLLGSVGNPRVNYFSLDIEGAEFQVGKGGGAAASGLIMNISGSSDHSLGSG